MMIIIKPSDKGLGTVVMERDWYLTNKINQRVNIYVTRMHMTVTLTTKPNNISHVMTPSRAAFIFSINFTLKFMFLFKNGVLPDLFKEMFFLRSEINSYNTRNSNSFHTFNCRTNIGKLAIIFQGPIILFNQLNSDIKNAESISLFKTKLKAFF